MNERDWLRSLDHPRPDPAPVDVVPSVLHNIRTVAHPDPLTRPLALMAGLSALAATVVVTLAATQLYDALSNPLSNLVGLWTVVIQ